MPLEYERLAQLAFVDPSRALVALPSPATVLAYPAAWLADPAFGADFSRAVNGEQSVVPHRTPPVAGERDVVAVSHGRAEVTP